MREWLRYWYEADSRPAQGSTVSIRALTVIFVIASSQRLFMAAARAGLPSAL
jgi:hypothetical protein